MGTARDGILNPSRSTLRSSKIRHEVSGILGSYTHIVVDVNPWSMPVEFNAEVGIV